jgi:uncharacterized protein YfaS (alpha-2-macroglobulin family)
LSLTGYTVPNPFDTFYALHPLRVAVADSRTRVLSRAEYLVKGANPGGGGADPNARAQRTSSRRRTGTPISALAKTAT